MDLLILSIVVSLIGILFAIFLIFDILKKPEGSEEIKKISLAIRKGASAFLVREWKVMGVIVVIFAIIVAVLINPFVALSFIFGNFLSAFSGFIGMTIATRTNGRTTNAARKSGGKAIDLAFSGGAVMGLTVSSFGILGLTIVYILSITILHKVGPIMMITGYSMGASFVALFARVGGGIFTKAADVGADLVGKIEAGIPEDDPRNPATIADNVGDNVGDVAGMGADLYESYVGATVSSIVIAITSALSSKTSFPIGEKGIYYPFLIVSLGLISSILGVLYVKFSSRIFKNLTPQSALTGGTMISSVIFAVISFIFTKIYINDLNPFYSVFLGLISGVVIGLVTQYYTGGKPIKKIAEAATTGAATNILAGFSTGMESTILPLLILSFSIYGAYLFSGIYGIALAGVGMLATLGISLSVDAYGPIADNAGGIAEMSHQNPEVRDITDSLDAYGNTTAAMGKGFAIGSAVLTALALFVSYAQAANISVIDLLKPNVISAMFIGGVLPYFFSGYSISAVEKAAFKMVEEVRRQFREMPGILEGKDEPDYKKCVDISTIGALREMIIPSIIIIISPFVIAFVFGKDGLGGFLAGSLISGALLAIFMANSGGAWDNAKKLIEKGMFGGKGSPAHKASIVGDTVGDPFKDTAGPSINILLKLMSIISLVFLPFFLKFLK
ncbi:MAG TPA: sodium-translocating pyrophosphatase [Caldisericia bacterium]|nr:sodium-translocating pyrophosphatase [Caldisericia bacterium]HPB33193.1 sodium-translocating pyrophosphatase [Caldisericia bacterium]HQL66717.1 sodium-translocating pyrophosphatase [Caldisericia bacterium]HQN47967.1 sodium-translocating pyrophosphatase [Caldisericia bacterium]HQO99051.1 sodium-translocating pyrophosphatase [Caldisericia bacterium]